MFTGNNQVVGDDGGIVVKFNDVEIVGARILGRCLLSGFDEVAFVVEVAVGSDTLEIVRNGALDRVRVLALGILQELLLAIDKMLVKGAAMLGRRRERLGERHGRNQKNRAQPQKNASHDRLQETQSYPVILCDSFQNANHSIMQTIHILSSRAKRGICSSLQDADPSLRSG